MVRLGTVPVGIWGLLKQKTIDILPALGPVPSSPSTHRLPRRVSGEVDRPTTTYDDPPSLNQPIPPNYATGRAGGEDDGKMTPTAPPGRPTKRMPNHGINSGEFYVNVVVLSACHIVLFYTGFGPGPLLRVCCHPCWGRHPVRDTTCQ